MSRNGSGVYTLPAGNPVVSQTVISSSWANNTMNDLAAAMTDSVAADGQTPMTGPLNVNSNKVVNLANATVATDAVNYGQFSTPTFSGAVVCSSTLTVTGATILGSTLIVGGNTSVTGTGSFTGGGTFGGDGSFTGNGTFGGNLAVNGTGQVKLPNGTTGQRSATPAVGSVRYNTTLQTFEGYSTYSGQTISSITRVTTTATLTTAANHNLTTGTFVTVSGATPVEYNGTFSITVTGDTTFTYTMLATPSGSASPVGSYLVGVWGQVGGGATGNGGNQVFVLNDQAVTASYTIPSTKNASSAGPITINTGVTVTVSTGSTWVIV
jgi:hypothetical protein